MIKVNIEKNINSYIINNYKKIIEKSVIATIESEKVSNSSNEIEVNVNLLDQDQVHFLNNKYRGVDKTTDVLSFPLMNNFDLSQLILGDIIINTEKISQQAKENNRSEEEELAIMTIHSTLHLLGYDHMEDDEEILMNRKEKDILSKVREEIDEK